MAKQLFAVLNFPEQNATVKEGDRITLHLQKSGRIVTFKDLFVFQVKAHSEPDWIELILEAAGDPVYNDDNTAFTLTSKVIVCWLPTFAGTEGTAHVWLAP